MTTYKILEASNTTTLERNVTAFLSQGYQLVGGVSCCVSYYGTYTFAQAMILVDNSSDAM